jgi:hypothetical protein
MRIPRWILPALLWVGLAPLCRAAVPVITGFDPSSVTAGGPDFNLTISGQSFTTETRVYVGRIDDSSRRDATLISGKLTARILAGDIASPGSIQIIVQNPGAGGGDFSAPLTVSSPAPFITGLNPASALAGGPGFQLTIEGGGFLPRSTVRWNGADRTPAYVSASRLTLNIAAADIAAPGSATVVVVNQPGGLSNTATFAILARPPRISGVAPSVVLIGSAPTLTVVGESFVTGATVFWGDGNPRPTTFVNATTLGAALTQNDTAGTAPVPVYVTNPDGQSSDRSPVRLEYAAPSIATVVPSTVAAGSAGFTLTINGSGFAPVSTVRWNNADRTTIYVNPALLLASISAGDVSSAGIFNVAVLNPPPGGGQISATVTVTNPTPVLTALSPSGIIAGGAAITLTIQGNNFVSGSTVRWNSSPRNTTLVSASQLLAAIPASDLTAAGATVAVTVSNPPPGGGVSNALQFTLFRSGPRITDVSPVLPNSGPLTVTVTGGGFLPESRVLWGEGNARPTSFVGETVLTAALTPADTTGGVVGVYVVNPDGQVSERFAVRVEYPAPVVTSLSPSSVTVGSGAFTLTITGSGFVLPSAVRWNGSERPSTYVSANLILATLTSNDVSAVGVFTVTVTNPAPGGGVSGASVTVEKSIPRISSLSPASAVAGGAAFTLTVNGTGFTPASKVRWNGSDKPTLFVRPDLLAASIAATDIAVAGTTATVVVANPDASSEAILFSIVQGDNPLPRITSIAPTFAVLGGPAFTLTVTGTGFVSASRVRWNGGERPTTLVSSTRLTAAIPATDIVLAGSASVTVFNPTPGGGTSNATTFTISLPRNPLPATISLDPTSAAAGGTGFTLIVNGNDFVPESRVQWNGSERQTAFASATQLTAAILAADIASGGDASVTVTSPAPGGGVSSARTFVVCSGPCVTSLGPTAAPVGGAGFVLTVNGSGFAAASTVRWNGADRSTRFVDGTQLTATIAASDVGFAGSARITVATPVVTGESISNGFSFAVETKPPAALTLLYPRLVTHERSSGSADDSEYTGFAVVNLSSSPASLVFTALDTGGTPMNGASLTNPAAIRLGPGEQLTLLDTQMFGSRLARARSRGWMKLESDNDNVVGFFLAFNSSLTVLDGADVSSKTLTSSVIPEVEDIGYTQILAANPNRDPAAVTFELVKSDGTRSASAVRTVSAGGVASETVVSLFPGVAAAGSDHVRVSADRGVAAFEFLGSEGVYGEGINAQDASAGAATLYSPQYVVGGSDFRTTLSIVNLEATAGSATLRFIKEDGSQAGATRTISIPAQGKVWITDQKFFLDSETTQTQGYVEITSSGPKLTGSVVFSDPGRAKFSTALPLVSRLQTSVVFSQLASDATYYTGISILNPGDADTTATLDVIDRYGNVLQSSSEVIPARRRKAQLLSQYFPELADKSITSGYIRLTTDKPVAAFALYGTVNFSVLAAVSAQVVP